MRDARVGRASRAPGVLLPLLVAVSLALAACQTGGEPSDAGAATSNGAAGAGSGSGADGAGSDRPARGLTVGLALTSGAPAVRASPSPTASPRRSPTAGTSPGAEGEDEVATRLGRVVDELGATVLEISPGDGVGRDALLRRLVKLGSDVVVAVGPSYAEAVEQVAREAPDVRFALVDDESVRGPSVTNLVFAEEEGAFLVGAAAALTSTSGTVGLVAAEDVPRLERYVAGYTAGVRHVRADGRVAVRTLPPLPDEGDPDATPLPATDPDPVERAVEGLSRAGADVVFAVGDREREVFDAAQAVGAKAAGIEVGEPVPVGPPLQDVVLLSMVKRLDTAVEAYLASVAAGDPLTGVRVFDLEDGGVGYTTTEQIERIVPRLEMLEQQIVAGDIVVPDAPRR